MFDDAAERGTDAEHREVAAGDDLGGHGSGVAAGCEIDLDFGAAEHAVEETGLLLEFAADRVGQEVRGADGPLMRSSPFQSTRTRRSGSRTGSACRITWSTRE